MNPRKAFTLVELLVVIGIIAVLIAILLPTLSRVRQQGNAVKCASNLRQLTLALTNYAAEYKGRFPPNINDMPGNPLPGHNDFNYWYDADRLGRYLPKQYLTGTNTIGHQVMTCPNDIEDARRSVSMNLWASSGSDTPVGTPARGQYFGASTKGSSQLILLIEAWSKNNGAPVSPGWFTSATAGYQGTKPGERFVGIVTPSLYSAGGRVPLADTEIDFTRHRTQKDVKERFKARGRVNIGFADGHVEMFAHDDLADPVTRKSRLRALWSPLDYKIN
jgi:prepilin-type N-terminal cleavage/methylation domain-containing protein/prepilin-type processing-associated H-X9-DG protein